MSARFKIYWMRWLYKLPLSKVTRIVLLGIVAVLVLVASCAAAASPTQTQPPAQTTQEVKLLPIGKSYIETTVPEKAIKVLPTLKTELSQQFSNFIYPFYFGALIEHESCLSLTHSRCYEPTSQLLTSREQGVGFFQLTRAWDSAGKERFDTIRDLKNKYRYELQELSWSNVTKKPELQIRAGILLWRDNYGSLSQVQDEVERIWFADAAFNGGIRDVHRERQQCGLAKNCNPQYWFSNVELQCVKSKRILYGVRSACDINRHHVADVRLKTPKYQRLFGQP